AGLHRHGPDRSGAAFRPDGGIDGRTRLPRGQARRPRPNLEKGARPRRALIGRCRDGESCPDPIRGEAILAILAVLLGLVLNAAPEAPAQTPAETARTMLRQYQDDPTRIERARDLLEAAVAKGTGTDVPTLLALARAW